MGCGLELHPGGSRTSVPLRPAKWEGIKPTPFEMYPRWGMVQVRRRRRRPRVRCAHQLGESAENQAECRQICQISESDQLKVVRNHAIGVFWRPVAQLPLGCSAQNSALRPSRRAARPTVERERRASAGCGETQGSSHRTWRTLANGIPLQWRTRPCSCTVIRWRRRARRWASVPARQERIDSRIGVLSME